MNSVRVLHIDDEPDIREIVAISLSLDSDIVLRSCGSGEHGLAAATKFRPDLVLLDVKMPVMDGTETLGHLRDNWQTIGTPVVFMTGYTEASEVERLKSLGAVEVIKKPFDPMTLSTVVRSHLRR
jgi:two-component system OmpR family response regulator